MSRRRVAITGLGMITPLGHTVPETWQNILEGKSGVRKVNLFDASNLSTQISASVQNFDPTQFVGLKEVRKMDTFIHFAIAASKEALIDSGIDIEPLATRFGVAIGSGIGGLPFIEKYDQCLKEQGPRKISPFFIPGAIINMASGQVSIAHGLKGPNVSIVSACSTGSHNIGYAARLIQYGEADAMLAGGTEMATTPLGLSGFAALRALSRRNEEPERASRPWDKNRDGFVLGDGAGVVVLEEYERAKRRGAKIYAELVGVGLSADAYHMTSPDEEGEGAALSMKNALIDAHLNAQDIAYINAHSTSTPAGDVLEIIAIKKIFGEQAYKLAVSSTKSMIGHLLGASGAVEAIFSILAIRDQVAPPTINLDNPDEGCDINLVPHHAQAMKIDVSLSNSFGFGGTNGTLIFKKPG